jgi:hypothetical protein
MSSVIVVGAGPYGLSLSAQLSAKGIAHRIIGKPLDSWRNRMPSGMFLKSDGFASNLFDADSRSTLSAYCAVHQHEYHNTRIPVPLDLFNQYATDFQQRHVPHLEDDLVIRIDRAGNEFALTLSSGETLCASHVVIAVGITHFAHIPDLLADFPADLAGRTVTVLGAGASAADVAASLRRAGASTRIVARKPTMRFHSAPSNAPRPIMRRLRHPESGIGPGLRSRLYTDFPGAVRLLPERVRHSIVRKHLGPAPGWKVREEVVGHIPLHLGQTIQTAQAENGRMRLTLSDASGSTQELVSDHIIAATGFTPVLARLPFLAPSLRQRIRSSADTPQLSAHFESSVPGLYFTGPIAANMFGPLMRFMVGAGFAARQISTALARL